MGSKDFELILLVENTANRAGLLAEHGLSFWVNYGGESFLFDTGQGLVMKHNIEKMGLDLSRLSAVFLSHGHYDHSGGLAGVLTEVPDIEVYAHERLFSPKYGVKKGKLKETGIKVQAEDIRRYIPVEGLSEVRDGLTVIGGVERTNDYEKIFPDFKVKAAGGLIVDDFKEEISLLFETEKGPVVVTGCSHLGIVNILEYIQQKTGIGEYYAVIGGFHLINAEEERIRKTIDYLESVRLQYLYPIHCTGFNAVRQMVNRMDGRVKIMHTGDRLTV